MIYNTRVLSIEWRKTKTRTKVMTRVNQNKGKYHEEPIRNQSKMHIYKRPQARENASDQVAIGFSFASDWLKVF